MASLKWGTHGTGLVVGVVSLMLTACGGDADGEAMRATAPAQAATAAAAPAPSATAAVALETKMTAATPPVAGWEAHRDALLPHLVRVSAATCSSTNTGTGYFIDDRHVVAAAETVDDAVQLSVQTDGGPPVAAALVEWDLDEGIALLRTPPGVGPADRSFGLGEPSDNMEHAIVEPDPDGRGWHTVPGALDVEDAMMFLDASDRDDNAGAPVLDRSGALVAMVTGDANVSVGPMSEPYPPPGYGHVVRSSAFMPVAESWSRQPTPVARSCGGEDPDREAEQEPEDWEPLPVSTTADHDLADDFALVLHTHGMAINTGQYQTAWAYFTPEQQAKLGGLESWSDGIRRSFWQGVEIRSVRDTSDTTATVGVTLRTSDEQLASISCTVFALDYEFSLVDGSWLIDRARTAADSVACSD